MYDKTIIERKAMSQHRAKRCDHSAIILPKEEDELVCNMSHAQMQEAFFNLLPVKPLQHMRKPLFVIESIDYAADRTIKSTYILLFCQALDFVVIQLSVLCVCKRC